MGIELGSLQKACQSYLEQHMQGDPAHDISHVKRVVNNTIYLTDIESANSDVTVPAAWLHDCVSVAKDSDLRAQASVLAADQAVQFLASQNYPEALLPQVHHAIVAHSFSADVATETLEARVVQDADRLEAVGAIGIARCLLTGGSMGTALYEESDPFCAVREPNDRQYTVDHFYSKLLGLTDTMKTEAGRTLAAQRTAVMRQFLDQLRSEIEGKA